MDAVSVAQLSKGGTTISTTGGPVQSIANRSFERVGRGGAGRVSERSASLMPPGDKLPVTLRPARVSERWGYRIGKRLVDIIGASFALIVLAPIFLALIALVRLSSPGPVFHRRRVLSRQDYQGEATSTYDAFKFRTMIVNADAYLEANPQLLAEYSKGFKLTHDPRVTRFGAPLRRLSLDELPQLWNILRGQMSLVGPRMISPPELGMYGADAARLLSVKPGLTGLWQVSGRTNLSYDERVHLDMFYIENRSLPMDIAILVRTVGCVLARRGAI